MNGLRRALRVIFQMVQRHQPAAEVREVKNLNWELGDGCDFGKTYTLLVIVSDVQIALVEHQDAY